MRPRERHDPEVLPARPEPQRRRVHDGRLVHHGDVEHAQPRGSPTSYQFRTRILDKKNHTAYGYGPKFKVARTQNTSTSIHFSSGWTKTSKGSPSGGNSQTTTGKGKTATMTFTGRGFAIVGTVGKGRGSFTVYVDGVKVTSSAVKTSSTKTHDRRVLYARTTANGTHTIKVVTSGNGRVDLDAILTFIAG